MATRKLSVKFDTEGFSQAINQLQATGKAFDTVLKNSQEAIRKAKDLQSKAIGAGDIKGATAAQKQLEQASKASARAVAASYRELGIKSSESINRLRAQAVSAFEAIKNSGTASARDVKQANEALTKRLKELEGQLNGTANASQSVEGGFNKVQVAAAALVTAVVGVGGAIAKITSEFISFDDAVREFGVVSQSTPKQLKLIREEVERLGIVTSASPAQVAKMSIELARAGFKAEEVAAMLESVVRGSEATGEQLSTVGDIVGKTIKQFGLAASDAGRVTDLLVQTANNSNTSISSLGESLKFVGTSANDSGQSLEDTLAFIGLVGNAGLQGGQGGRNFAAALEKVKLASAGATDELILTSRGMKSAAEAVEAMGIEFRGADGKMRPMIDLLPEIQSKLKTLSEQDKDVIFKVLFGTEGGRAIRAALQGTGKDLDFLVDKLKNAEGVAIASGKAMNEGLGGRLRLLEGSFSTLQTKIAAEFAPALTQATETVINALNGMIASANDVIAVLAGIAAATAARLTILALSAAIQALITAMASAGSAGALFKTALAAIASPANLAALAIGAITVALVKFGLDARKARQDALNLGDALDSLATKSNNQALVDLGTQEASARAELAKVNRNIAIIEREIANYDPVTAAFGGKNIDKLRADLVRAQGERSDIEQNLLKARQTRTQIENNIFESRKMGPPAPTANTAAQIASPQSARASSGTVPPPQSLIRPTPGRMTSPFGMRRHPIHGDMRMHRGVDFGDPMGAPIKAPLSGRISNVARGFNGGAGNLIDIETVTAEGKKITQRFFHLSEILKKVGDVVQQGEIIGKVGSTGDSTGPHLHWEVKVNGKHIDPMSVLGKGFAVNGDRATSTQPQQTRAATPPTEEQKFIKALIAMAARLKANPEDILKVMLAETGGTLDPAKQNPRADSKATGLIQFMPTTAKGLGTSIEQLAKMTAREQLPFVERYFRERGQGDLSTFRKVLATVFTGGPNPKGNPGDGDIRLNEYLARTEKQYGSRARQLISNVSGVDRGDRDEFLQKVAEDVRFAEDAAKAERAKVRAEAIADFERRSADFEKETLLKLQLEQQKSSDFLAEEIFKVDNPLVQAALSDRDKEENLYYDSLKEQLKLTSELARVGETIKILDGARVDLSIEELRTLENSVVRRGQIEKEIEIATLTANSALAEIRREAEIRRREAIAQNRELIQSGGDFDQLNTVQRDSITLGDPIGAIRAAQEIDKMIDARDKEMQANITKIEQATKLGELRGEELEQYQALLAIQEEFDGRRLEIERLIVEARNAGNAQAVEQLEGLLVRTDELQAKQTEQVAAQFDYIKTLYAAVTDNLQASTEQAIGDLFTLSKGLGDIFRDFATSILQDLAKVAAKNVTRILFGGLGFASGGLVRGAGTGTSDSIPARLSNGEFVMSARSVKYWGTGLLGDLNSMRSPRLDFAGSTAGSTGTSRNATVIMNVTTPDANSFRRSETQMGKDAGEQLRRSVERNG